MNQKSRRDFFKKSTGLLTVSMAGLPLLANISDDEKIQTDKLIYRTLGKTGIKLPIVSVGSMSADNPALLKEAYRLGIRHYDTAWLYQNGRSEMMLGDGLRELNAKREEVTIGTKILLSDTKSQGAEAKDIFLKRFNESLERLKMDYVDILYYHAVSTTKETNDPYIREAFETLKAQKKIRFTGFSTHNYWPELVDDAAEKGYYDVILLSFNYAMHADKSIIDPIKRAKEKGIGLIAMKTQCRQDWSKKELPQDAQKFYEGQIMHSALLKWVLRHDFITTAIPGVTTFDQLSENMKIAYNLEYTENEKKFLTDRNVLTGLQKVCRLCSKCEASCPYQVEIANLMRVHMYAHSYGNIFMANTVLKNIPQHTGLDKCKACTRCVAQCIHNVAISERINDLKLVYC